MERREKSPIVDGVGAWGFYNRVRETSVEVSTEVPPDAANADYYKAKEVEAPLKGGK